MEKVKEVEKMEGFRGGEAQKMVGKVGLVGGVSNPEELYAIYCFLLTELYTAGIISKSELNIKRNVEIKGEFKCLMEYALGFVDGLNNTRKQSDSLAYRLGYALAKGEKFDDGDMEWECREVFTNIRNMLGDLEEIKNFFIL